MKDTLTVIRVDDTYYVADFHIAENFTDGEQIIIHRYPERMVHGSLQNLSRVMLTKDIRKARYFDFNRNYMAAPESPDKVLEQAIQNFFNSSVSVDVVTYKLC